MRTLREATQDDKRFFAFPYREFFWRIGMTRTTTNTDWNGDFLMTGQSWSTARDFARFGLLYMNDGVWLGERILPQGWVKYVTTRGPAQPARAPFRRRVRHQPVQCGCAEGHRPALSDARDLCSSRSRSDTRASSPGVKGGLNVYSAGKGLWICRARPSVSTLGLDI